MARSFPLLRVAYGTLARHHTYGGHGPDPVVSLVFGVFLIAVSIILAGRTLLRRRPTRWRWMGGTRMTRIGELAWSTVPATWGLLFLNVPYPFLPFAYAPLWLLLGNLVLVLAAGFYDTAVARQQRRK